MHHYHPKALLMLEFTFVQQYILICVSYFVVIWNFAYMKNLLSIRDPTSYGHLPQYFSSHGPFYCVQGLAF